MGATGRGTGLGVGIQNGSNASKTLILECEEESRLSAGVKSIKLLLSCLLNAFNTSIFAELLLAGNGGGFKVDNFGGKGGGS